MSSTSEPHGIVEDSHHDLTDWRLEVQESVCRILETWVAESHETLMLVREFRDSLAEASIYGSYTDQARIMKLLLDTLSSGMDGVMRIIGQFDSPTHVVSTLHEGARKGLRRPVEDDLDRLDAVQREQLVLVLRGLVTEAKGLVAARAALPAARVEGT